MTHRTANLLVVIEEGIGFRGGLVTFTTATASFSCLNAVAETWFLMMLSCGGGIIVSTSAAATVVVVVHMNIL